MTKIIETTEAPKLTIKTTVTESRQVDIEVDSPYYCKYSDGHFFKVEENFTVSVKIYSHVVCIEICSTETWGGLIPDCEKCSKEDFDKAFETALSKLQTQAL